MTSESSAALTVEATVVRGDFTLDVSFSVDKGEVLAILGPNGAGKSTILHAVAGLLPVSTGTIRLDDHIVDQATDGTFVEPEDRSVGFVFQDYKLFPHLSVLDNVAFAGRARGQRRSAADDVARLWLERLRLTELADRRPADLSGGQAQRVALARALAADPSVLLLDEPLAALDAQSRLDAQAELRHHLSTFAGAALLVTHDLVDALTLADRILVLEDGRVVQIGSPAQVARRPANEYVASLVGLNLYAGHADGTRVDLVEGGTLVAPEQHRGDVLIAVRPSAITISLNKPESTSARNTWPARVVSLTLLADRVRLELHGAPPALVDVTPAAVADLELIHGAEVWLSLKATELEVYPRSDAMV
jgi:molybdate transport system ATP-binding protein